MQPTLFDPTCPCGQGVAVKAGLCRPCYFRAWHSRRRFAGLRDQVLSRDGHRCRVCGTPQPVVHHRRRDVTSDTDLITICPACHARIERLTSNRRWMPELLLTLWAEQHPSAPMQMQIEL